MSWLDRQYWNDKQDRSRLATNWNVVDDSLYPSVKLVRDALDAVGNPGSNVVLSLTAGEALSGHKVVRSSGGQALYANSAISSHGAAVIGITTAAASSGAAVSVQSQGTMTEPSFAFTPGQPIYLSGTGGLSHTPASSGVVLQVAVALTATTIIIDIKQPINV